MATRVGFSLRHLAPPSYGSIKRRPCSSFPAQPDDERGPVMIYPDRIDAHRVRDGRDTSFVVVDMRHDHFSRGTARLLRPVVKTAQTWLAAVLQEPGNRHPPGPSLTWSPGRRPWKLRGF